MLSNGYEGLQHGCPSAGVSLLQQVRTKYTYKFKQDALMPGLIFWKPRTPGLRHKITLDYEALGVYTGEPHPGLSAPIHKSGGRNATGRITCRHRGGGDPKVVREVDWARKGLDGLPGRVARVEADPGRSGFLALVRYAPEGQLPFYRYHLAPAEVKAGDILLAGPGAPVRPGNWLPLREVPVGMPLHCIELQPGKGGVLARSANTCAIIQSKQEQFATVQLPSGETRLINLDCRATVGQVSNHLQRLINLGKAGERRRQGWRPTVRGIAMNPIDHPHGGRGNGGRPSCSPWGVYKGKRTRRRNKSSNKFILVRAGGQPIEAFVQAKKWRARAKAEKSAVGRGGAAAAKAGAGGDKKAGAAKR